MNSITGLLLYGTIMNLFHIASVLSIPVLAHETSPTAPARHLTPYLESHG